MKKITFITMAFCTFWASNVFAQYEQITTFMTPQDVSNDGLISGYLDQAGPYWIWNPDTGSFESVGGAAPGLGIGGSMQFSADGNLTSGTSFVTETNATDWIKTNTGFNYIFNNLAFFGNEYTTGYAAGQSLTYNGDGIVIRTYDNGETWEQVWAGEDQGLLAMSFANEYTGYIGGWNGFFAKTETGGFDWVEQNPGTDVYYYSAMEFKDDWNGVVAGLTNMDGAKIYSTEDGGTTWTEGSGITGVPQKITFIEGSTYYLVTNGGDVQRSTDDGATWTTLFSAPSGLLTGIEFYDSMNGIATGDSEVFRTTDGGATWSGIEVIEGAIWRDVAWQDADHVTLVGTPELIFSSEDGGATWPTNNLATSTLNEALYEVLFAENGYGFIIGSQGVLFKKAPETNTYTVQSMYNRTTGIWSPLGSFNYSPDNNLSAGYNISADGLTVVGLAGVAPEDPNSSGTPVHATAWNETDGLIDLGSLHADVNRSTRANSVNGDGSVIVGWQDLNGPWKSAVWRQNPDGTYAPNEYLLIDPNGDANDEFNQLGEAMVVTTDGTWIGGQGDYANDGEPWIWSEATGYISLGSVEAGSYATVSGINDDATIAVGYIISSGWGSVTTPFIWTVNGGLQDLNDFITGTLGYEMTAGPISYATTISPNGRFITGSGYDPTIGEWGDYFTFRLEMPDNLSIDENTLNAVNFYPNPVDSVLHVNGKSEIETIEIYNVNGQQLFNQVIGKINVDIDLSEFNSGMYFMTVNTVNNESNTIKIIKN